MVKHFRKTVFLLIAVLTLSIFSEVGVNASRSRFTGISSLPAGGMLQQREPRAARKARLKQEAKDRQLKKDYEKFVKNNQKRSIEIQSPEVQERMKQNVKDANSKYKAKKKSNKSTTKRAARKYR